MSVLIKTNQLTKKYKQYAAVNQVDFQLKQGEIFGLIGKNGAGKTTLLKLLMGLANPTSGNIELNQSETSTTLNKQRKQIGFMIEPTFFGYLNARDNLKYSANLKGIRDNSEIDRVLNLVGLGGVKKPFKAYSMGMKQRLALANALVGNPDLIILDEPINGLDPSGIADFRNLILKLNRENNQTFVVSSHILSELALMATRFGFIDQGVLLEEMSSKELHDQRQKALIIKTDDANKTVNLLKANYPNVYVNDVDEVIIPEFENSGIDEIANTIFINQQKLYKLVLEETTLEEYYFNLIGGAQHA